MESDLRPGGKWMTRGVGRGGKPFRVGGEYRKIERPRLLVFTWLPDWEENASETLVRFDLDEKDGVTTVRLTHSGLTSESSRAHHRGWPQVLAWLQAYVEDKSYPQYCSLKDLNGVSQGQRAKQHRLPACVLHRLSDHFETLPRRCRFRR
jgi:hypothetical protein